MPWHIPPPNGVIFVNPTSPVMTIAENSPQRLTETDERLHALLTQAKDEFAGAASFLSEYGISTALAQQAAAWMRQPLAFYAEMQLRAQTGAAALLAEIVVDYIRRTAEAATVVGLWRVERPDETRLEYTIALRDDVLEHRALFHEFRLDYHESGLGRLVPLVFHLIPAHLTGRVRMSTKIELAA